MYTKRLIFSWSQTIKITSTTSSSGVAILALTCGLVMLYTVHDNLRASINESIKNIIVIETDILEIFISREESITNIAGALLPIKGNWSLEVIN